ncbi:helix-turn-helix transcriptional regulator [Pseudoroseomonas sp. WGS1072]|uniref:helix-turn-helix transcriptional regulator n=1 Tax=Roseomonas sp. WGS1072 TaxID=3366816 RepID=UPI003BF10D05
MLSLPQEPPRASMTETPDPPGLPVFHFSTEAVAPPDRLEVWRGLVGPAFEVRPEDEAPVAAEASHWRLGPLDLMTLRASPMRFDRPARRARRDGADHYSLMLFHDGSWSGDFGGMRGEGTPGAARVLDLAAPFASRSGEVRFTSLSLPRDLLDGLLPPPAAGWHGVQPDGALGTLFRDHLLALRRALPAVTAAEAPFLARATAELLAAALSPGRERLERARAPAEAALLHRARRLMRARLHEPQFRPEALALALGLSRSSLYRLFAPLGGVAAELQRLRLERAHALLGDPAAPRRVGAVAFACGFAGEAQFSRAFRRAYGCAPREVLAERGGAAATAAPEPVGAYRAWRGRQSDASRLRARAG